MPELHKNQIAWQAPEPKKVSFDVPNYAPLEDAFNQLGRAANEFVAYKNKIDDIDAKAKMDLAADTAYAELSKYEPSDDNYAPALNKFNQDIVNQLNQFDNATVNRFNTNYPDFMGELNLKAQELVFEKQQKRYIQKAKETSVLLASEVVEGKKSREQAGIELDDMIAKVDNLSAEEIRYGFRNMIQLGTIESLVAGGKYSDALKFVENPKESDTLTPEQRVSIKKRIESTMEQEAAAREKLAKDVASETNSMMEKGLLNSMLYALDKKDNTIARLVSIVDDPNDKVDLRNDKGEIIATVSAESIPPEIRREALKKLRTFVQDSQGYRMQSYRTKALAEDIEKQNAISFGTPRGQEVYADAYAFMQTPDFQLYLKNEEQEKIYDIVYGAAARSHEQVLPYENFRYENMLYGVGAESYSAPSPMLKVRGYMFGPSVVGEYYSVPSLKEQSEKQRALGYTTSEFVSRSLLHPMRLAIDTVASPIGEDFFSDPRRGFRQATSVLRDNFEKETNMTVRYGSQIEYLMNTYVAALATNPNERKAIGLANVSDEQIDMAYNVLKSRLVASGQANDIIGQAKDSNETQTETDKKADSIRKEIFNTFYSVAINSAQDIELPDDVTQKKLEVKQLIDRATTNIGHWNPTEATMQDEDKIYETSRSKEFYEAVEKKRKDLGV